MMQLPDSDKNAKRLAILGQSGAMLGVELCEISELNPGKIYAATADYGQPSGLKRFSESFPEQFFNCGIAEQNLIGISAGLSAQGNSCIAVAQACFISMRGYEPVRQLCGYMGAPIILVGISAGFSLEFFGNTHYALEDLHLMRSIPNIRVFTPSDTIAAVHCLREALKHDGPSYIRCTGGTRSKMLYQNLSEISGTYSQFGSGTDVALVSHGAITQNVLAASKLLSDAGKSISVIDLHEKAAIDKQLATKLSCYSDVFFFEEHASEIGFGSLLKLELSPASVNFHQPVVEVFGHSVGTREFNLAKHFLDTKSICKFVEKGLI